MSNQTANLNPCAEASREDLEQAAMSLSIELVETRRQRDELLATLNLVDCELVKRGLAKSGKVRGLIADAIVKAEQ